MRVTSVDIVAVEYAIDVLEDQIAGGSEDQQTEIKLDELKRLLKKLKANIGR